MDFNHHKQAWTILKCFRQVSGMPMHFATITTMPRTTCNRRGFASIASTAEVESKAILFKTIRNLRMDRLRRDKVVSFEPMAEREFDSESEVRASKDDVNAILQGTAP
jgi:hypothetical protein